MARETAIREMKGVRLIKCAQKRLGELDLVGVKEYICKNLLHGFNIHVILMLFVVLQN